MSNYGKMFSRRARLRVPPQNRRNLFITQRLGWSDRGGAPRRIESREKADAERQHRYPNPIHDSHIKWYIADRINIRIQAQQVMPAAQPAKCVSGGEAENRSRNPD